ncbi:AIPR family protein [Morganella morganii]|uniref:AIPR family protein n=1 Tax=Morganella morganii TaxID=582 RepID=UPI0034D5F824
MIGINTMLVTDLTVEDNLEPASATSSLVAKRIGNTLKARFEQYIHTRECKPDQKDYDVKMTSRSIAAFCISQLGKADDQQSGESVCDSSLDGGIDAIFVNHSEKIVVAVQSKFNQSGANTWSKDDFLSFKSAIEHLLSGNFDRFDEVLQKKEKDLIAALDDSEYQFKFAMIHTGKKGAADIILQDMQHWQKELNRDALMPDDMPEEDWFFQVHLISAEDIQQWLRDGGHQKVDLIGVELIQCGIIEEPQQAIYGTLTGDQLHEWYNQFGTKLFTKNIRNLLGKTDVNESIKQTVINEPHNFWFFNNGITLLVNEINPHRRNIVRNADLKTYDFKDVSIINGAQTVSTIGTINNLTIEHLSQVKVLARFIKINSADADSLSNDITIANNHQNRVTGRDFAAQHHEQRRLANEIAIEGCSYMLLRTGVSPIFSEKNIDMDEALSALACLSAQPHILATLKSNRGKFFENLNGNLYKAVFNPSISGLLLINSVTAYREIEKTIADLMKSISSRKGKNLITHGIRVLTSISMSTLKSKIKSSEKFHITDTEIAELEKTINCTYSLADKYISENYPSAYLARFFQNREKIDEVMSYIYREINI